MAAKTGHILFYPACVRGRWVARCLDYDITGTGEDPEEAFEELMGSIEVLLSEAWRAIQQKKNVAPPRTAPKLYWKAFKRGLSLPPKEIEFSGWVEKFRRRRAARFPAPPATCRQTLTNEVPA